MTNNKIQEAQNQYVQEIKKVQSSADNWQNFLDFAAQMQLTESQQDYEFSAKLIIHSQNPNATDGREFGEWKTDGNHVNRHETSIPVLTRDSNGNQAVKYLFDTSQTAHHKQPDRPLVTAANREHIENMLAERYGIDKDTVENMMHKIATDLSENISFSDEQKRLFCETAEYKLCKQYGLETSDNAKRFNGIDKLSVKEIANIGTELNKLSTSFKPIIIEAIERSKSYEQERADNSKSGNDRTELHGYRGRGMDLGGGVSGTRQEVLLQSRPEAVVQAEHGEPDIRTNDRNAETNADSSNGQVRQSETGLHMADPMPVGASSEWGRDETLRGNERPSSEYDRENHGEEKTDGRVQENRGNGEISSESTDTGEIQNGSGGRSASGNSLRNITDSNETAEPEKGPAVSVCYDKLKKTVISDERIQNAITNSDRDNLNIEIENVLNETAIKIFNEDVYKNIDFYADFVRPEKSANRIEAENYIRDSVNEQYEDRQNVTEQDMSAYEKQYERFKSTVLDENGKSVNVILNNPNESYIKHVVTSYIDEIAADIYASPQKDSYEPFITDYFGQNHDKIVSELFDEAKSIADNLNNDNVRTYNDIAIGDKYQYKGREYNVVSMQGIYPDDVGISYNETLSNGTTYEVTENVNKHKLENEGIYLGKDIEANIESAEPEKKIPNTLEHRNFKKIQEMFPDIMSKEHLYERHESESFEPLSVEWIGGNNLSLMHTYTLNGDLMRDPDIVFKVDFNNETITAVSYENSSLGRYEEYEDGSKGQRDTNRFMNNWLDNIEQQGFSLSRSLTEHSFEDDIFDIKVSYKDGEITEIDGDDRAVADFIRKNNIQINTADVSAVPEEPDILGTYAIYQLKDGTDTRDYRFISSSEMEQYGLAIDKDNYNLVYSGELTANMSLDSIYERFNINHPEDFTGHSLSVSDIIVLDTDNGMTAHYVDSFGFKEVPEFLREKTLEDIAVNITEKNMETVQNIEVGDEITLNGESYVVKSINGSFMMNMDRKDVDENSLGVGSRQFIGDWRKQLVAESGESLLSVTKANAEEMEYSEPETNLNKELWDVRIIRARNEADGIATHLSESHKEDDRSYVYGTYSSYKEASQMLVNLRKDIESDTSLKSEYFNKCPYYEREVINNMKITLDGEKYSVYDVDRLANTVDLIKADDKKVSMPYIMAKNNPDIAIRTEKYDYIDSLVNEQSENAVNRESIIENTPDEKFTEGEQMAMFDIIDKPYQVVTFSYDTGADDKLEYATLKEARQAGENYLADGYEQYAVFNKDTKIIEYATDMFPSEDVFSENVLIINGIDKDRFGVPLFDDKQNENEAPNELTEQEKFFAEADICPFITKGVLAHDEYEDMCYPLFEPDYTEKHKASEKSLYGRGLNEPELYSLANKMKNGEDIRKDFAQKLLGNTIGKSFDFEGKSYDFSVKINGDTLTVNFGNVQREVSYEEIGQHLLDRIEAEYNDIAAYRAMENAFDKLRDNHDFSENQLKFINRIEHSLGINGYNNISENLPDVLNSPAFNNNYGTFENMDKLMDNRLNDIIEELNAYVSGEEYISDNTVEEKQPRFKITDEHLGEGNLKEKFRNNVEAIKTLQLLEREERLPTEEEQKKLSKYIGWGGLDKAFNDREPSWNAEYYELKNLLTEEEYEAANATVTDAFYTSPVITKAIYEALENMGFEGGEVLEPSMGIGNFFGTMPDNMRENSNLSGIEIDSISGRIAQKLYPEADIAINGFEKIKLNKGTFDLAIGNVPFGTTKPNDKTKAYKNLLIHDYFFAKSIDSVRPGGIVAFISSTGTLDKEDTKVRQMLAQKAELLGAIRLPGGKDGAFKSNAGTEATTDIIFLKRREKDVKISDMAHDKSCDWVHTRENKDGFKINNYFADNPDMILGTLDTGNFGATICKAVPGTDLKEQLHEAVKNIKGEYKPLEFQSELNEQAVNDYLMATPDIENLTYTVVDDKLYFRVNDNLIPLKESEQHGKTAERRKAMCDLALTVRELLQAQVENLDDSEITKLQTELNTKYEKFVQKYDRINPIEVPNANTQSGFSRKNPNSSVFKNDVRLPLLQSLEKMRDGQFVEKAEIFTERTIRPHKVVDHVETSHEALILSVSEKGRLDFEYMQKLTGFEKDKIISDLKGDIYPVPELSTEDNTVYQTSDEYLSGNIYKKIAAAEAKLAENPAYADNITALKEIIPTPLKATEIEMQLGMAWIDPKIIQQFMYETFETPTRFREYEENLLQKNYSEITVSYSSAGKGSWQIQNAKLDNSVKATKTFGTNDYNAYQLLENALNGKAVTVTTTVDDPNTGKKKRVILEKETKAAEDKLKLINAEFSKWIFKDPERRNELVKQYNELFNCIRPREYDGTNLNFYGSNPEITLKPHQKNAVAHALFGGNTLFAHEVGAGKTFEMIATAMEGKRLGLHNKSMFVVPNHLTEQIGSDFMKLYPNANILVAKSDDFSPQKRRQMCARIATGNFDAVIIGHSQLIKIPLSVKREQEFIKNQINDITASLEAAKELDGESYTVKQLATVKKNLSDRLDKLVNSTVKDSTVTFEELGVDKLFVDEAHEFKNLYVATKMENVSGLSTNTDVQKTQDLFMKCQYLDEITNNKGIVFATGTPVTNALSEMFTTMKYLQNNLLKELGIDNFDSWAGNFTKKTTETEISPSGNDWRLKTRLKFTNVPELVTIFKEAADIKMADQLDLDVPECEKNIVSVEPTEIQKSVVQSLGERAERIHLGAVPRNEDNMLVVTGDGRKLGLDQRLYNPDFPDEPHTKINACVENVYDIWEKTTDKKSTQLVFCDLGVPQSKEDIKKNGIRFDVYADIKAKLLDKGIPENEIAFIHDASSETEKAKLFAKVRRGDIRVLIGSTQKMGAGTNVQNKLVALHDLDCPWRPADLTQRLGRMVRQGNENEKVANYRYVTKGTFDAYLYQMVEAKQRDISQIFTSKNIKRTYDDIDDTAMDFNMAKTAAVGDERIRRQMELKNEIRQLKMLENVYKESKYELEDNISKLPKRIAETEKIINGIAEDTKLIKSYVPQLDEDGKEKFIMKVGNITYDDKKTAAEAFKNAMTASVIGNPNKQTDIAEYKGFKISVGYDSWRNTYTAQLKGSNAYPFDLGTSEIGNMTRIDNIIASVPIRIDNACNELERLKTEIEDSKRELEVPFEHEAELQEKQQEFQQLSDEIEADKLNGKTAPEQPESTVVTSEKKEEATIDIKTDDSLSEKSVQIAQAETKQAELSEKNEQTPSNLNIRWTQGEKKILITYDNNAENKVAAYVDNKKVGQCSPEQLIITATNGDYPKHITKCIEPLNIAFSNNTSDFVEKFIERVKNAHQINSKANPMFNRDKIMADEFKPTSEKNNDKSPAHGIGG